MHTLDQQQACFPDLVKYIDELRVYYDAKLWKQISDTLLTYIKDPRLQAGSHLKDLYEGFVKKFHNEIDEMKLARFLIKASKQYEDRIGFLDQFTKNLDKQPALVIRLLQAYYLLEEGKLETVDEQLKGFRQCIERMQEVDPLVYSMLYLLALSFYKVKANYEEFYVNALQYLAYTHDSEISEHQRVDLSHQMALAVLISPTIYNFSELLQQPLLASLHDSEKRWIYTFLEIFNRGDVEQFRQHVTQHRQQIEQEPLLRENFELLQEKIRIMSFLELAFQLPKNSRVCSFKQLAGVAQISTDDVERLVMRTISKGLVKGRINQIEEKILITYVVPRVLGKEKIEVMARKFESWEKSLGGFLKDVTQLKFD